MVDLIGINSNNLNPNRVQDRSSARSSEVKRDTANTGNTSSDRIEISSGARDMSALRNLVQTAQAQPEVRTEAVEKARQKLENGEFNGVEVSREAAKNILGV